MNSAVTDGTGIVFENDNVFSSFWAPFGCLSGRREVGSSGGRGIELAKAKAALCFLAHWQQSM